MRIGTKSDNEFLDLLNQKNQAIQEKFLQNIENLTNALITVYGRTVAIIGEPNQLRLAVDAISSLSAGSLHGPVYSKL